MKKIALAAAAAAVLLAACDGGRIEDSSLSVSARAGEVCLAEGESLLIAEWEANAGMPTSSVDEAFEVPAGCAYDSLTVRVEWDLFVEDLDLEVLDANGTVVASSGAFNAEAADASETAVIAQPAAGAYTARVNNFAGLATAFTGTAILECTTVGGCLAGVADDQGAATDSGVVQTLPPTTRVVVAVIDSAINPYHEFYYAGSEIYAEQGPSSVTPAVLQELGVKPENVLQLTRTGNLQADLEADADIWASVKRGESYWVKGTNVVIRSYVAGDLPVLQPTPEKSSHGVGTSAAVLLANPEAVIVFVETEGDLANDLSHDFAFLHPAVDIISTSYGISIPNTGFPLPEWRAFHNSYEAVVDLGKLHFSSGGNGPGLTPLRAGAGPWWSIGVSGIEEGDSEGRSALSGNFPDFLSDFYQNLPYCHDSENCYQGVGGTSFSTPRAAGVASRVLLEARRSAGHKGGIQEVDNQAVMVSAANASISNWFLRRSLEQAAYIPDILDYDPVAGVTDLIGVPVNPLAPWLQVGWGDLSALPEKGVVSAALAHLGFEGEAREKAVGFCEFQTEIILQRKLYWDNIAASLPDVFGGDVPPPPLDEDPFIYCESMLPTHPASNDPGGA